MCGYIKISVLFLLQWKVKRENVSMQCHKKPHQPHQNLNPFALRNECSKMCLSLM